MSNSSSGFDKIHDLTIRFLDARYNLTENSLEDYVAAYESVYNQIKSALKKNNSSSVKVLK